MLKRANGIKIISYAPGRDTFEELVDKINDNFAQCWTDGDQIAGKGLTQTGRSLSLTQSSSEVYSMAVDESNGHFDLSSVPSESLLVLSNGVMTSQTVSLDQMQTKPNNYRLQVVLKTESNELSVTTGSGMTLLGQGSTPSLSVSLAAYEWLTVMKVDDATLFWRK